jgi:hypothetical protein
MSNKGNTYKRNKSPALLPHCPKVLGIDPGLEGAFVLYDGKDFGSFKMPVRKIGKGTEIVFDEVHALLHAILEANGPVHVFLERAVSFGMGSTGAFNYGRGFAALEIALQLLEFPVTYVEPHKWTKEMHAGISKDLKPKAKSLVAIERLFPKLVKALPRNTKGRLLEGPVDALLIAGYGYRTLGPVKQVDIPDFY